MVLPCAGYAKQFKGMNVDLHPYLTYVGTTAQTLSSWKKTPANYGSKVWAKITEITHYEYATKTPSI